ncbi:beta-lactamase family protein [Paenibacillus doosanensis]|uniref:6-aminohexanoate-dimer hydrolase n=1 Tax=Paenibacillus konkukensis TaxID=2020716 RepID=A0ABY4RHB7_9BACL|nr:MULTISPECIES: serine hydrolase [Paenibacillus]MCS7463995.1 beta-lactamase family protein [Paenibacillus doosanensis]UQZ81410.1 6-aminohexanoate-dimer hydrolase [Paenibacillus konkukensis]
MRDAGNERPINAEQKLPRSTPEEQGVAASGIAGFLSAVEAKRLELHGLMIVRHGHVVAEGWWAPYNSEQPHMLFSLSKSFTSTAVGFAVAEGLLTVEDKVASFFAGQLPEPLDERLAAMRVKDLLTMSAGHASPIMGGEWRRTEGDWARYFLSRPMDHAPGSRFMYNSGATYMLSAIVQKAAGQTLLDYLLPRLFQPLGIRVSGWDTCPSGINTGGWGLSLTTEDLAKFGQFYLQKGVWRGKRLLPEAWIEQATSCQIANSAGERIDSRQGYGYQFWRSRHNSYRADGAFGQFCIVMPEQDAVIAIHGGLSDMQGVMDSLWEHLLPAMSEEGRLPGDRVAEAALRDKLQRLALSLPRLQTDSPLAARISGKRYAFGANPQRIESVTFEFGEHGYRFHLTDHRGTHRIDCGLGQWHTGVTTMTGGELHHRYEPDTLRVAASAGWRDDAALVMTWCFVETPFTDTVVCRFEGGRLRLERSVNVNSGETELPVVWGELV